MLRLPGTLLLFFLLIFSATGADASLRSFPPELQARLQGVLNELQEVEEQLRPIRTRAEQSEALSQIKGRIDRDILSELQSRHPELKEKGTRLQSLLRELSRDTQSNVSDSNNNTRQEKLAEFHDLRNELQPHLREIRALPEFRERIDSYEKRLEAAMKEASTQAADLIARRDALHIQFHRLQREALESIRTEDGEPLIEIEPEPERTTPWVLPQSRRR